MSFLMHLSRRLICTIMIRRCPSVVVNFHIFHSSSETTEQNSTKLDRKQDHNFLYLVCVSGGRSKNSMAALASNWQKHLKPLIGTQRNLTGSKIPTSSTKFFRANQKKQDGLLGLWLPETYWNSPLKPLNGIQWNLTGSKISMSSTKFEFELIGKARWPPWPLIRWDIFHFSSENRWTEFKETWQESRSQCPLLRWYYLGWSEKQYGRMCVWLAETFSTSPLKPLNGVQRNLTGRKISTSSTITKFMFFGPIRKTRWPPWQIRRKGGTLYLGARYVALWASCLS